MWITQPAAVIKQQGKLYSNIFVTISLFIFLSYHLIFPIPCPACNNLKKFSADCKNRSVASNSANQMLPFCYGFIFFLLFFTFFSFEPINITGIWIRYSDKNSFVQSQIGETKMCNTCGCRSKKKAKKKTAKKKTTKKKTTKKKVKKKKK